MIYENNSKIEGRNSQVFAGSVFLRAFVALVITVHSLRAIKFEKSGDAIEGSAHRILGAYRNVSCGTRFLL